MTQHTYPEIDTPALVIDADAFEANVAEMARITRSHGVKLRPHTKTHKIPALAKLQLEAGATGITCSTLGEAEVMAAAGCRDIHVVLPVWGRPKLHRLQALRERARVVVSLDSQEVAEPLARLGRESGMPVEIYVNVDTGDHRVGLAPGAPSADLIVRLARLPGLDVQGIFTHAGHSYLSASPEELEAIAVAEATDLLRTADLCRASGVTIGEISPGSTPTARRVAEIDGVTELRPGTYAFNNTKMIRLGVASESSVAAHVVTTVVARPTRDRVVTDAGSKVLSSNEIGVPGFVVAAGWPSLSFTTLAVDVGVARLADGAPQLAIGDRLALIPSCSVVDLFEEAHLARGGRIVDTLPILGRGKVT